MLTCRAVTRDRWRVDHVAWPSGPAWIVWLREVAVADARRVDRSCEADGGLRGATAGPESPRPRRGNGASRGECGRLAWRGAGTNVTVWVDGTFNGTSVPSGETNSW